MRNCNAVIVNYGAPRSGTTWMRKALAGVPDVLTFKLAEGRVLHPCQSEDGLIELAKILRFKKLVIIRTVRDPMELAESWVAVRSLGNKGAMRKFTDENCVEFICNESARTQTQLPELTKSEWGHEGRTLVEVRYERMDNQVYHAQVAARIVRGLGHSSRAMQRTQHGTLCRGLATFGKKPVRPGRLAAGRVGERFTTPDQRKWFERELWDVIQREGYVG